MSSRKRWNSLETQAWRGFIEANRQVRDRVERSLAEETNLSSPDYTVLVALIEAPEQRLRPTELGEAISWEKSRLSMHIARMEKRDLIRRESFDGDGRSVLLTVTEKGREAIRRAAPLHAGHVRKYFLDALTPEQQDALGTITESILAHLATLDSRDQGTAVAEGIRLS